MASASENLHEPSVRDLPEVADRHRAIVSIQEELEAVDWYDQRVHAVVDPELGRILAHNRDEEKEHASMLLAWLRRRDPGFAKELRTYLFSEDDPLSVEAKAEGQGPGPSHAGREDATPAHGSLGIGSLKGVDDALPPT